MIKANRSNNGTSNNQAHQFDIRRAMELLEWFEHEKQEHLLRRGHFVPNSETASFGKRAGKCEASALTAELTAQFMPILLQKRLRVNQQAAYFDIICPNPLAGNASPPQKYLCLSTGLFYW
jgi:hypothetical protein